MTDRYAVIGHPVAHSKSPWIHAAFARQCGEDIDYGRIEAPPDGFVAAVRAFRASGGRGLNVTLPFKGEAFAYATRVSARAKRAQAVNTLVFGEEVVGDTTDGVGLVRDLDQNLAFPLRGRVILLVGAGGAAQGVAEALLEAGPATLTIANRTASKASELAKRFDCEGRAFGELAGRRFDLIVNATSAGLRGEAPALPSGVLERAGLAYDMVYGRATPFLVAARTSGVRASDGLGMLVEQAAESFYLWRAVRPRTAPVLEALRASA
ncbi:MAG: shikimate dehydrogenase [Betaproteobacteria bacterium]|nr:shikimate dehydrogenase [Betaproteobacteria bacterium]